ncbi:hypothetical protein ACFYR1_07765 [Streptomyces canus]|uniref:hypothetical protein n=1 Tax=Streptomyces canus TaxID=58343 RepID=UPI0036AC48AA
MRRSTGVRNRVPRSFGFASVAAAMITLVATVATVATVAMAGVPQSRAARGFAVPAGSR